MAAYIIFDVEDIDPGDEYVKLAGESLAPFQSKAIVHGGIGIEQFARIARRIGDQVAVGVAELDVQVPARAFRGVRRGGRPKQPDQRHSGDNPGPEFLRIIHVLSPCS